MGKYMKWICSSVVLSFISNLYFYSVLDLSPIRQEILLTDFQKITDESHLAQDKRFNHKTENLINRKDKFLDSTCALIFFGCGRKFKEKTFPSIEKYILGANPYCKVFVHTFNVSDENGISIDPKELSLLTSDTSSIIFESEEDFQRQRNVTHFHQYFPTEARGWKFPTSMDNMIHQWHSISKAWEMMEDFETNRQLKFNRVGLFRPDVLYTHPVPIGDKDELAVIPSMMYKPTVWNGLNDRMFYGSREYGQVWATQRFDNVEKFIQWQHESFHYRSLRGLHSEDFMRYLVTVHGRFPLKIKNVCFKRVRPNGDILHRDCMFFRSHHDGALYKGNELKFKTDETDLMSRTAPGVIVLGMHRSGTSMLVGLLSTVFSWNVPGRHVTATKYKGQNSKGFYENVDVMRQNDVWMRHQHMTWDKVNLFDQWLDGEQVVVGEFSKSMATKVGSEGEKAIEVYNNAVNTPWVMKEPRMCLTLDAWTPLLHSDLKKPPILFTYRNPLEVAMSLQARKRNSVPLLEGLRLWIWYNREAIRLSSGMCRVITRLVKFKPIQFYSCSPTSH